MALNIWLQTTHLNERESSELPLHGLFFLINSKRSFTCTIPDNTVHTKVFVTPVLVIDRNE